MGTFLGGAPSGTSVLQVVPIYTTPQALTTTVAIVGGAQTGLVAAEWDQVAGKTPEFRLCAMFLQVTTNVINGDVLEVQFYDANTATVVVTGTVTVAATNGTKSFLAHSAWTAVPVSRHGYLRTRNQTGARGDLGQTWFEIRYV